jgi:hypothetical protein
VYDVSRTGARPAHRTTPGMKIEVASEPGIERNGSNELSIIAKYDVR